MMAQFYNLVTIYLNQDIKLQELGLQTFKNQTLLRGSRENGGIEIDYWCYENH